MPVKLIGEHPLARADGKLINTIANVFPAENAIVTGFGTHGSLVWNYIGYVNEQRKAQGVEPLTKEESASLEDRLYDAYVPLHMREDIVLIRPNCSRMGQAFAADEILQQIVPKEKIKFLGVLDEKVRKAIKQRGELWRISTLPKTIQEMKKKIADSKEAVSSRPMYYHSMETGTRYITYEEFERLGSLPAEELAKYMNEIRDNCCTKNTCGQQEIKFFMADQFSLDDYADEDFTKCNEQKLRFRYEALKSKFRNAVKAEFRRDDPENEEWRKAMLYALVGKHDEEISEEVLLGLCPEFFMHIQWLPGAGVEHGEVIFDSVFEKDSPGRKKMYDEKVRSIILNFRREFDNIEYINVGRVIGSLSKREKMPGRREVYIVEVKIKDEEKERVKMIRLQKFGAVERLQSGKETDVYKAFWNADEYKRYTLDRWNACEQLGMKLLPITTDEIYETFEGIEVPLIYFERDYIDGRASDKIPASRFENKEYAARFAELLGQAAAVSMIAGRVDDRGAVHFDDGDEVIVEDEKGMPVDLINADITSSFGDYTNPLMDFAEAYAQPVIKRMNLVGNIEEFAKAYISSFVKRFEEIQQYYRSHKGAFDSLFKDRIRDEKGSFAYRWEQVLNRMDRTVADALGSYIISYIKEEIKKINA